MTHDTGASRTFRSIFGETHEELQQQQLQLHVRKHSDVDMEIEDLDAEEDDDEMWNDGQADIGEENNNTEPMMSDDQLQSQPRSMEEWAEGDDDEDNWKDALQARVNQLELVIQSGNNDQVNELATEVVVATLPNETVSDPPAEVKATLPGENNGRVNRHKIQRTSSSHTCSTGGKTHKNTSVPPAPASLVSSPKNHVRKRAGSKDFVAQNIRAVDMKRAQKTASPSNYSEEGKGVRARITSRKNSMDGTSSHKLHHQPASATGTDTAGASKSEIFRLSDPERVRRYVMTDVKQMSMARIVLDAKRLYFLEGFYKKHQQQQQTTTVAATTAVSPSPSSSSTPPA